MQKRINIPLLIGIAVGVTVLATIREIYMFGKALDAFLVHAP